MHYPYVCIYICIYLCIFYLFLFWWSLLMGKKNKYHLFVKERSKIHLKNIIVELLVNYHGTKQNILDHICFNDMGIRERKVLKNLLFPRQSVSANNNQISYKILFSVHFYNSLVLFCLSVIGNWKRQYALYKCFPLDFWKGDFFKK